MKVYLLTQLKTDKTIMVFENLEKAIKVAESYNKENIFDLLCVKGFEVVE